MFKTTLIKGDVKNSNPLVNLVKNSPKFSSVNESGNTHFRFVNFRSFYVLQINFVYYHLKNKLETITITFVE